MQLRIPQSRDYHDEEGRPFYPKSLDRGVRSERAMTLAVAEMYVQVVSTRKVPKIVEELCGLQVTSTQVSRAAAELDEELAACRNRPLGEVIYLILDARYEKFRHGGAVVPCAMLTAIGVTTDGKRSVLGCSVARSEAETHWRAFLESLHERGMRGEVADDIRRSYNADDRAEADRRLKTTVVRYHKTAPGLASWLEENIPETFEVFAFPAAHRKRLRTNNGLERLSKEIKRRTRVATLFPNEASVLRLVSAVLSEISAAWKTERVSLNMKAR